MSFEESRDLQWWITGFNPDWVGRVDKKTQAVIRRVDFSKFTDQNGDNKLYQALKDRTLGLEYERTFVNFDDDNKTVWLCWYWDKELQREKK